MYTAAWSAPSPSNWKAADLPCGLVPMAGLGELEGTAVGVGVLEVRDTDTLETAAASMKRPPLDDVGVMVV